MDLNFPNVMNGITSSLGKNFYFIILQIILMIKFKKLANPGSAISMPMICLEKIKEDIEEISLAFD